jgi:hypothetical protein
MGFENLTRENILLYALKAYDKPNCVLSELDEDLKHFSYVRRLFRRYYIHGELRERLILNHLVILYNLFGTAATRLLFFHSRVEEYPILKTFLTFLNYQPICVPGINGKDLISSDIPTDPVITVALRKVSLNGSPVEDAGKTES